VLPRGPDELAWLSRLADRFDVQLSPYPSRVFDELSAIAYGGIRYADVGERGVRAPRSAPRRTSEPEAATRPLRRPDGHYLTLLRYRPLFSGPVVERVPELRFQRPPGEVELSLDDATRRGIATGDEVLVRSNGYQSTLRARVDRSLIAGVVRIAEEHAQLLHAEVEVMKP
jgi:anaerobic selenocysteine-containing dehydrogenase